jgi:hypothetical protein
VSRPLFRDWVAERPTIEAFIEAGYGTVRLGRAYNVTHQAMQKVLARLGLKTHHQKAQALPTTGNTP